MEYKLLLASNSPRRKQLLAGLDIPFTVNVLPSISEDYPSEMPAKEVAKFLAVKKAEPYKTVIANDELVLTADTVVIVDNIVLGKPQDSDEACAMLRQLSGKIHQVVTGVCLTTLDFQHSFSVTTNVTFKTLSEREIKYYVEKYNPTDKAGAYGIQEWIGYIGVTKLEGSYFNVMGLPVQRIYDEFQKLSISIKNMSSEKRYVEK